MAAPWHRARGLLLAACGLAWSPRAFDAWIGSGVVEEPRMRALLWGLSGVLLVLGLAHLLLGPSRALMRADMLLLALFLVLPLVGELLLRVGIATARWGLRDPMLYADPMADDDYWLMRSHWLGDTRVNSSAMDPELGWGLPATPGNPLAVLTTGRRRTDPAAPVVAFFGDSFVAGPVAMEELIPQQLDALLPRLPVLNYGVGGYGLDQICLRYERYLPRFPQGIFVVGVMTRDIDRAILRFRSGQKPWVAVEDGRLVVRGQPIDMDQAAWLERNPIGIHSFFAARLAQWGRRYAAGGDWVEGSYRRELKVELATLLFERIVQAARASDRRLLFVLFDPVDRVGAPGWRESLCRELIARLGVPWVDAGAALQREAAARGIDVQEFFRADNHPNAAGNAVIARAVAAELAELGWVRPAGESR